MTDFSKILDKAKELEAKMKESQQKIKEIRVMGISGSNSVKITLDGDGEMQLIELSNEIMKEDKNKPEVQTEIKAENKININTFENLIEVCSKKKEIKLKYELEKNVNLVKFEKNRIEISFNESLDKDFVKNLSSKLFEWTDERWIITFSKLKGQMSINDKQKNAKKILIDEMKNSEIFKSVLERFPDAELIDVNSNKNGVNDD